MNWQTKKLGEIFNIERGGSPRPIEEYITDDKNGINWIKIGDTKGVTKYITKTNEKIKPEGLKKTRMVYEDDFILSNSMSFGRPYIMKTNGCIHDGWLVIRKNENIDNNYLYYVLTSNQVYVQFSTLAKGSTVKNLNIAAVKEVEIPVPPLETQHAIVSKIEELFSELDKGIAELKTAQQQLKTYRQSVLKSAFEGKLTNENVKNGELPDGWEVTELKNVCEVKRGKSKHRPRNAPELYGGNYPFIQTGDIRNANGSYIKKYSQTYSELGLQQSKLWPKGTLCITIAANIGETAILDFDACFPDSVVGLLSRNGILFNKYLNYFFISFKQKLEELAPATAQKNINVDILERVNIPLAPLKEQHSIVEEIESRLSVADKMEQSIQESLQKAEALRQSILKKAFCGELV